MAALKHLMWLLVPLTALCSLSTLLGYIGFRFYCLLSPSLGKVVGSDFRDQQNLPASTAYTWLLFILELIMLLPNTMPYVLKVLAVRPKFRSKEPMMGDDLPRVDIFVTACREDNDIILDTVRACLALDYPLHLLRVFVSDDGANSELARAIMNMQSFYPMVFYTARVKGPIPDYKAGNLNHVLRFSANPYPNETPESSFVTPVSSSITVSDLGKESEPTKVNATIQGVIDELAHEQRAQKLNEKAASIAEPQFIYQEPAEYLAGLDADMIPEPNWLRVLLPHIMNDPKMSVVCPPQLFYDIPANDILGQTMIQCAGITEIVHDTLGHADCLGSGYIMRRAALESIGGVPTESISEDVCCSATLLGAGWKTAYVPASLQYGCVPNSYIGHIKQRTRWFIGHCQTAALFNLRLFGKRGKHLSFRQRLTGLAFDLRQLVQLPLCVTLLAIPAAILTSSPFVFWTNDFQLVVLLRLVCAWSICHWIHAGTTIVAGRMFMDMWDPYLAEYESELERWLSPYFVQAFFRSFVLPVKLGGTRAGFTPTGSLNARLQERDKLTRAPLHVRLRAMIIDNNAWVHLVFVLACISGVIMIVVRALGDDFLSGGIQYHNLKSHHELFKFLLTRIAWPPVLWLQYTVSMLVPLIYAVFPPSAAPRETLLERDPDSWVARPTKEARGVQSTIWGPWKFLRFILVFLYTVGIIIYSIWLNNSITT